MKNLVKTLCLVSLLASTSLIASEVCEVAPEDVVTGAQLSSIEESCTMKNNPFGLDLIRANSNRLLYPVQVGKDSFELVEFTL